MFADDTKLYRPIKSTQDHLIVQQDLDDLVNIIGVKSGRCSLSLINVMLCMSLERSPEQCDYT